MCFFAVSHPNDNKNSYLCPHINMTENKMENKQNKYIAASYQLYSVTDNGEELVEKTTPDRPFQFISGFGLTLEAFEKRIADLAEGETFEFQLTPAEAYGERDESRVVDLDKAIFTINNHFDHDHIYKDAIVPLQNEDGNHFFGHVLDITDDKVKMDLNHPLAGKTLRFVGKIDTSRDATNEEIEHLINHLQGGGCSCGCDECGDGCGEHHHHHHEGGCCGCH